MTKRRRMPRSVWLVSQVLRSGKVRLIQVENRRAAIVMTEVIPTECDPQIHEYVRRDLIRGRG